MPKAGDDGDRFPLSKNRFVTVSTFKSRVHVDIREFYVDDAGERKPGKKGISLTREEWDKLKENMDDIEKAIKKNDDETDNESD